MTSGPIISTVTRVGGLKRRQRRLAVVAAPLLAVLVCLSGVFVLSASSAEALRFSASAAAGAGTDRIEVRSIDPCAPPGGALQPEVEVILLQGDDGIGGGSLPIDGQGHWRGTVMVSEDAEAGALTIEAACYADATAESEEDEDPYGSYSPISFVVQAIVSQTSCPDTVAPTIAGTAGPDRLAGTAGADVIHGLGGNDWIAGLGGDDVICGGTGDDDISGGDGRDQLFGDTGNDRITGGNGQDGLFGGPGRDQLSGGADNDNLVDRAGVDQLAGGPGRDILATDDVTGGDSLSGGPGGEGDSCMADSTEAIVACTP